jgi:hypothetical protein
VALGSGATPGHRRRRRHDAACTYRAADRVRLLREGLRRCLRAAGTPGTPGDRRDCPCPVDEDSGRADDTGQPNRPVGPRGLHQFGDRRAALPQPPHRRVAPGQGLRQTRCHLTTRTAERAARPTMEPTGPKPLALNQMRWPATSTTARWRQRPRPGQPSRCPCTNCARSGRGHPGSRPGRRMRTTGRSSPRTPDR